ncbi:hypothetical protein [Neorhizobium sp. P12A]|uniref:hypothetical protein n=1 Tax=Neorhizobium sp. P12A TaxID=2268027 RepID=UPI00165D9AF3|nr:hypothetical protein [Neorhizobium sp. P12A]
MLHCMPVAVFATGIFDMLSDQTIAVETAKLKRSPAELFISYGLRVETLSE